MTKRQSTVLRLWESGMTVKQIARALNVDKSTISRTLTRAKRNRTPYHPAPNFRCLLGPCRDCTLLTCMIGP